jgi:hypothetical protein
MEANVRNPKNKGKGGSGNYEHEKWGPPKPGELGICYVNGTPYVYCGKKHNGVEYGWNTTHSTKSHKKWAAEGTAFNLALKCRSHELVLKSNTGSSKPKFTISSSSAGKSATANHVVLPDSVKAMLGQLSDSVHTPTEQVLMESMMKRLGLNQIGQVTLVTCRCIFKTQYFSLHLSLTCFSLSSLSLYFGSW